jgi:hypothetical protein
VFSGLEKATEKKVVDWWRGMGGLQLKLNLQGQRGWPDRLFLVHNGQAIFIEFKREGEELRPLQEFRHKELGRLGYRVYTCDSVESAKAILASA